MRGRKKKTPRLRLLHGQTPPNHREGSDRVLSSAEAPEPFEWMSEDAQAEWRRVAPQLHARGLLTVLDMPSLAIYCECLANYMEARRIVGREGSVYTHNGLTKKHPAVGIRDQAARDAAMWARELGLLPTSRQRLGADDEPGEDDPLGEFLNGDAVSI